MPTMYNKPPFYFCNYRKQFTTTKTCPAPVGESTPNTNKTMTQNQLFSANAKLQTETVAHVVSIANKHNVTLEEVQNCQINKTDSTSYVGGTVTTEEPPKKAKVYGKHKHQMSRSRLLSWASTFRYR